MSLDTKIREGFTYLSGKLKATRVLLNGNATDLSALTTNVKTNVVAAINEVNAKPSGSGGAPINDSATSSSSTWSSQKTSTEITSAAATVKQDILGGAGAAYDTLQELKALVDAGDAADQTAIGNLTTAVGNRVRYDAAQTLTAGQTAQARSNINAVSVADVGPTDTDYVAIIDTALAS